LRQSQALRGGGFVVKKKRFAIEQITANLMQAELGTPVADLCRKFGISEPSFYRRKKV
jgi:putative transposase